MEIIRKQNEDLNLYIDVKVLKSDVSPLVDKELKKIRKDHPFPGFRQGNTPMSLINKKFGKSIWWEELSKYAIQSVENYLKEEKNEIFGYPILDENFKMSYENIDNFEEMTFPFFIGLKPIIDDNSIYNNKFTKYNILVSDKDVEKIIEGYQKNFGSFKAVEKSNIDSLLKIELTQCDSKNNEIENAIHIESTSILVKHISKEEKANFIDIIVGEEKCTDLKKLFENQSELSSILKIDKEILDNTKDMFSKIKVLEIKNFINAELNQDLFDKCFPQGEIKTVEEYKIKIKEDIGRTYVLESNNILKHEIKEEMNKQFSTIIPLPEKFLTIFLNRRTQEDTEKSKTMNEEELNANFEFLRWDSFCGKIMTDNNISITENDIFNEAKANVVQYIIQQYGQNFFPDETINNYAKEFLGINERRMEIEFKLRDNKVLDSILDKFQLDIKDVTIEELNTILKEKYPNSNDFEEKKI